MSDLVWGGRGWMSDLVRGEGVDVGPGPEGRGGRCFDLVPGGRGRCSDLVPGGGGGYLGYHCESIINL